MRGVLSRPILIAVGAIALLLVGALEFGRLTAHSTPTLSAAATPTHDARIVAFESMVNSDMDALDLQLYKKFACKTRELCISELQDVRVVAESLVLDLTNKPPPQILSQRGAELKAAAQQFVDQVDATLLAMQDPGNDYVRVSAALDIHALDMAAGGVICWPGKPIAVEGGESPSGYVCREGGAA